MTGHFYLDMLLLVAAATVLGLWWTGTRTKELAVTHARRLCKRESVQLLDYTVALKAWRFGRSGSGSASIRREYSFEFTAEGAYRDQGSVVLNGYKLVNVHLPYTRDEDGNRVFLH